MNNRDKRYSETRIKANGRMREISKNMKNVVVISIPLVVRISSEKHKFSNFIYLGTGSMDVQSGSDKNPGMFHLL